MENKDLDKLFEKLQGSLDFEEPNIGHEQRFLQRLQETDNTISLHRKPASLWKPLSIAASVVILFSIGFGYFSTQRTINEQVAEISPEIANSQFYFASLIQEQVKQLENESTPETKKMVDDTIIQLKKLEADYTLLEKDLLNGGNSKIILSAMIINFQTRIDLLEDVLKQIEAIKNLKNYSNENSII